jgi:2,3-bisphosphoglycerate-dependent phosphoglycerate mutase
VRIYIIRHGESLGNFDPDNYQAMGDSNLGLTDIGWEQAIRAGQFLQQEFTDKPTTNPLGVPRLWASTFQRTRETASGIFHGAQGTLSEDEYHMSPLLIEQDFGIFSPLYDRKEQLKKLPLQAEFYHKGKKREKFYTSFPMGESPLNVYERAGKFIDTIHRNHSISGIEDFVIVTHGITARMLSMRWLHIDPLCLDDFDNPGNCDIHLLSGDHEQRYQLTRIYDGQAMKPVNEDLQAMLRTAEAKKPKLITPPSNVRSKFPKLKF